MSFSEWFFAAQTAVTTLVAFVPVVVSIWAIKVAPPASIYKKYSKRQLSMLLIPFSSTWEVGIDPTDLNLLREARRRAFISLCAFISSVLFLESYALLGRAFLLPYLYPH